MCAAVDAAFVRTHVCCSYPPPFPDFDGGSESNIRWTQLQGNGFKTNGGTLQNSGFHRGSAMSVQTIAPGTSHRRPQGISWTVAEVQTRGYIMGLTSNAGVDVVEEDDDDEDEDDDNHLDDEAGDGHHVARRQGPHVCRFYQNNSNVDFAWRVRKYRSDAMELSVMHRGNRAIALEAFECQAGDELAVHLQGNRVLYLKNGQTLVSLPLPTRFETATLRAATFFDQIPPWASRLCGEGTSPERAAVRQSVVDVNMVLAE